MRALPAAALAAALLPNLAGCAAPATSEARSAVAAAGSSSHPLFDSAAMRRGRLWREIGAQHLERAYGAKDPTSRRAEFDAAFDAFGEAQSAYHEALAEAPRRLHALIEAEIEQVARYMRQIQSDYGAPLPLD